MSLCCFLHTHTMPNNGLHLLQWDIDCYLDTAEWYHQNHTTNQAIQLLRAGTFRVYHDDPELVQLISQYEDLQKTQHNFLIQLPAEIISLFPIDIL